MGRVTHLVCSRCGASLAPNKLCNLCSCGGPLLARYDLTSMRRTFTLDALRGRRRDMWRYLEVLPAPDEASIVSLGEGGTPLLPLYRLQEKLGLRQLFMKDESGNPTGSFKARGMSAAATMARALGATAVSVPSAGNAAGALAAYAARAALECHIFMPADAPAANQIEAKICGAQVTLVEGLISEAAKTMAAQRGSRPWFDVSTLKEPYRIEGKKTMGYELAESFQGRLPDVILYPAGGGTGLIGMWKAFEEMEQLGWIGRERPRMIAIQAEGCAPIVHAFQSGQPESRSVENAHTLAAGLRVPKALGDFLMLRILRESHGCAIAVSDAAILAAMEEVARTEGLFLCPEGAACLPALHSLIATGTVGASDFIVLFNTGSGLKYLEVADKATSHDKPNQT